MHGTAGRTSLPPVPQPAVPPAPGRGGGLLAWSRALPGRGGGSGSPPGVGAARGAVLALTSRAGAGWAPPGAGGVPPGPYDGLDLALHVGDDEAAVRASRRALADELAGRGAREVRYLQQVHGADVLVVDEVGPGGADEVPDAPAVDAAVTAVPGVALAVLVADCVPVVMADPVAGVVGVAHAGRRGALLGAPVRAVEAMRGLGARDVVAVLGPSICARCYEVPADLRAAVAAEHPVGASTTWEGAPSLDVAALVLEQLAAAGVRAEQVPGCTAERADLWSYRRDGAASGRTAGLAWVPA